MNTAVTIFLGIFGGGTLITFIQFMISRRDKKEENNSEVVKEIKSIKTDIKDVRKDMEQKFSALERKVDDSTALQARARFLRFDDEVQNGKKFSKSAWQQDMQDMTIYKAHCDKYSDFPNDIAKEAMSNTMRIHSELLAKERDGEKVFL